VLRRKLSIAAPVYNEGKAILQFIEDVSRAVSPLRDEFDVEILLVNDGSTDGTGQVLDELVTKGLYGLTVVHLARNFGHPVACIACMEYADGDGVVLMDSDGQDDPNAIPHFVQKWREGYDVVYALRSSRPEGSIKRGVFRLFYRLLHLASSIQIPLDSGNYSLMDKRVVNHIKAAAECNRYLPGLRAWLGYRQVAVPVARRSRYNGNSRVGLPGLLRLASNAFFSFSYLPIRIFDVLGLFALAAAVGVFLFALYYRLFTEAAVPAWTSQIIITSFFGGINLLGIGIIGEYVARIYDQVKGRPKYTVDRVLKQN
jgi:polyisoprenyl-phosphate glycosyltransferase